MTTQADPIAAELEMILEEELCGLAAGLEGRLVRRWTAALERFRRRGLLEGASMQQAFRIVRVAPMEFEVVLRRPAKAPSRFVLRAQRLG